MSRLLPFMLWLGILLAVAPFWPISSAEMGPCLALMMGLGALGAVSVQAALGGEALGVGGATALGSLLTGVGMLAAVGGWQYGWGATPSLPSVVSIAGWGGAASLGALTGALAVCSSPEAPLSKSPVRLEERTSSPICAICRQEVAEGDPSRARCDGTRRDGRRCIAVYHRHHLSSLKEGKCEYCNHTFVERRNHSNCL